MRIDLGVIIAGIKFKNPVLTASGTFGYGYEIADLVDVSGLGGIITKTITLKPKSGNPPPRICEVAGGMLNAIGLQNPGLQGFLKEKAPELKKLKTNIIVSIAGETAEDYETLAGELKKEAWVSGIELNLSCPNLHKSIVCRDNALTKEIVERVKQVYPGPVIAKLSPNVNNLYEITAIVQDAGADAVTLVNTFPGMAIDVKTHKFKIANKTGGMSGPCVKPLALKCVYDVARCSDIKIPIIACGGISTGEDAVEFILAGASAVMVGTASFTDPASPARVAAEIEEYMKINGIESLADIKGMV